MQDVSRQNKAGSVARQSSFNEGKGSVPGSTPRDRAQVLIGGCSGEQYPSEVNLAPVRAQGLQHLLAGLLTTLLLKGNEGWLGCDSVISMYSFWFHLRTL